MNTVRIAAAGAGKTYQLCHEALNIIADESEHKCIAIVSYTNRGIESIKSELCNAYSGVIPECIKVRTWYDFILNEMIKPYQTVLFRINELKGINFLLQHQRNYSKLGTRGHYLDSVGNIRSETMSELVVRVNGSNAYGGNCIVNRLERIYSHIFIDEIQDLAGYDMEVVTLLMKSKIHITVVGDGKQCVFQTHYSRKNKGKTGTNVWDYFIELSQRGIVEIDKSLVSRRFNSEICNFANRLYHNENDISTCMKETTEHDGVFLVRHADVGQYVETYHPTVLRSDIRRDTDGYRAINFGECKGMTFDRVLVYPTKPLEDFLLKGKNITANLEKYYVAVTRARYSVTFVMDKMPKVQAGIQYEMMETLCVGGTIPVWHMIPDTNFDIEDSKR